jgi:hypothetical protein
VIITTNSINQLVFVKETRYVLCEEETEILNIMQKYLNLVEKKKAYQTKLREIRMFHAVVESTVLH